MWGMLKTLSRSGNAGIVAEAAGSVEVSSSEEWIATLHRTKGGLLLSVV